MRKFLAILATAGMGASVAFSADKAAYTNYNDFAEGDSILGEIGWDGEDGATAVVANETYTFNGNTYEGATIIFEGAISNVFASKVEPKDGFASACALIKFQSWTDTPDDVEGNAQAGFCVVNGNPYAWSKDGWIKLVNAANNADVTISSDDWHNVGIKIGYLGDNLNDGTPHRAYYRVILDEAVTLTPADTSKRYGHASPFDTESGHAYDGENSSFIQSGYTYDDGSGNADSSKMGINSLSFSGSGAFDNTAVVSGDIPVQSPLSSSVEIRAYVSGEGVLVEFETTGENGNDPIKVYLVKADGSDPELLGSIAAVGSGSNLYKIPVTGLVAGQTYTLLIVDEEGNGHQLPVKVTEFAAEMAQMSPMGISLRWPAIPGRTYKIQHIANLGDDWEKGDSWTYVPDTETAEYFVFFNDPLAPEAGFFRILMLDDGEE